MYCRRLLTYTGECESQHAETKNTYSNPEKTGKQPCYIRTNSANDDEGDDADNTEDISTQFTFVSTGVQ